MILDFRFILHLFTANIQKSLLVFFTFLFTYFNPIQENLLFVSLFILADLFCGIWHSVKCKNERIEVIGIWYTFSKLFVSYGLIVFLYLLDTKVLCQNDFQLLYWGSAIICVTEFMGIIGNLSKVTNLKALVIIDRLLNLKVEEFTKINIKDIINKDNDDNK